MKHVPTRPSAAVIEGLLITFLANRRALLAVPAAILAMAFVVASRAPADRDQNLPATETNLVATDRQGNTTLEYRREADAHRRAIIHLVQPAVPPLDPPPLHMLIMAAGALLALFATVGATLLAHAFARTYWQAETLEQDFGIAVIAVIDELPGGGRSNAPA